MADPQPNSRIKFSTHERPTYSEMIWQQLQDTKTEVRETRKELNARMDKLDARMDRLEAEMKTMRKEFNDNINDLRKEVNNNINDLRQSMQSSTNHGQIATISTVGIALGVLYSLLFK